MGGFRSKVKNPRLAIAMFVVALMALGYTGVLFSAQQLPQPQLKMIITPPGYPVSGANWLVQVFQRTYQGQPWVLANDSVILMRTAEGNFSYKASTGQVGITFTPAFGGVAFYAQKAGFASASYDPQTVFLPNELAYLVAGFYLFGGGLTAYGTILERERKAKKPRLVKALTYSTLAFVGPGYVLSIIWMWKWNFGTAWGFGNDITGGISFLPHLFVITAISAVLSAALLGTIRKTES